MEKIIYRQGDGPRGILETLHLPILRGESLRAAINTLCSLPGYIHHLSSCLSPFFYQDTKIKSFHGGRDPFIF